MLPTQGSRREDGRDGPAMTAPPGDEHHRLHHLSSPIQESSHHSYPHHSPVRPPSSSAKPSTPAGLGLGALQHPPFSPPSAALPSISSALFARETPAAPNTLNSTPSAPASASTFYDPTRPDSRYEPAYPGERRDNHVYGDARPAAQDKPFPSPSAAAPSTLPQLSPITYSSRPVENNMPGPPPFSSPQRPPQETPTRKSDPMSISNLMSGNDDPVPPYSSTRPSNNYKADNVTSPISPAVAAAPSAADLQPIQYSPTTKTNGKPAVNGNGTLAKAVETNGIVDTKAKVRPDNTDYEAALTRIDLMDHSDVEAPGWDAWKERWTDRTSKRDAETNESELGKRKRRRIYYMNRFSAILEGLAEHGRREYYKEYEKTAWHEVQAKEIAEEKERKKDMQRKRRREKAIQNESQKRDQALERAENAADGEERDRAWREAQKHDRKVRQTAQLLSGGTVSKDIREVTPHGPNLEGGVMSTFQMSDDAPRESRRGRGGRAGARLRKSKEQKQAEKDQAAAAQAAIERGETLPAIAPKDAARLDKLTVDKDGDRSQTEDSVPIDFQPFTSKAYHQLFDSIWKDISKRDVGKVYRIKNESIGVKQSNLRKTAQLAGKEARRFQLRTNKSTKDVQARAKRSMREMVSFWRRNERDERDQRKMAERQELENAKRLEAEREANRQRRKLNFLLSQTELYSHFIGRKIKTDEAQASGETTTDQPATKPPAVDADASMPDDPDEIGAKVTNFEDLDFDNDDESALRNAAMANAQNAVMEAQERARNFNTDGDQMDDGEMNFQNPTSLQSMDVAQPKLLTCQLKEYQLKGLNWLVNLYEQGINGILADEMGLGKTVQSISVMSYLAETHNIWGPFLVIAPASTLHNWQQEIAKFVPTLKVLPYWGTAKDRKVLRKFWDRKHITYRKESPFHVLVTSYQLVVLDTQYFQKMRWQYMILDEAQAIKSSGSSRWKSLLGFHCRNRLLLTGTPIQNNMQELWALLHFIMPSLFDSHDEFSDWFSKDIESHAQSNTKLNEDQLKRLHTILKPFMLRRIKKHVQKELGDKIELDVFCDLTYRQRAYYASLRNKISLMDLIEKAAVGDDQDTATLMNLVMQFRKVCNHPDLFERADTSSPYSFSYWAETASFMREGQKIDVAYSVRNLIEYKIPRLVYSNGGRLDIPGPDNPKAGWEEKALHHMFNIFDANHVAKRSQEAGAFSWLRFANVSAGELSATARKDVFQRAVDLRRSEQDLGRFGVLYDDDVENSATPVHSMFNIVERTNRRTLADVTKEGILAKLLNISSDAYVESGLGVIEPAAKPLASAPPIALDCSSQRANLETTNTLFNLPIRTALYGLTEQVDEALVLSKADSSKYPIAFDMLPEPGSRKDRFTHIEVPSMRRFISDCGKLAKLDSLLKELKEGGHRVLLYFQMTRMIDMMEEYLTYRNYKYCRLDGSTKLEDRRDTVADFQTRPDIFVFLLSTRAGGLGINLTSADTVIFYDSDWNPTIDSQAMDRAHRLGQTRQVTVYRLITRGTIEERIRKRALQKEEVQRVVISGQTSSAAGGSVDFNTRSRDNRTKDIALWLADDEQAEEIERREQEALAKGEAASSKKAKRKRAAAASSLEDLYHEGEGHFEDQSAKPSGAATPVEGGPPSKKRRGGVSKKAKTIKQRLAIADGEVNV